MKTEINIVLHIQYQGYIHIQNQGPRNCYVFVGFLSKVGIIGRYNNSDSVGPSVY